MKSEIILGMTIEEAKWLRKLLIKPPSGYYTVTEKREDSIKAGECVSLLNAAIEKEEKRNAKP